jgi:hypothetical protein
VFGSVGNSTEQENGSLHQERGPAVQIAHSYHFGIYLLHTEVRCLHPRWEAAGLTFEGLPVPNGEFDFYQGRSQIHEDS